MISILFKKVSPCNATNDRIYIRKCLEEEQTRQFLGLEYPNLKALQSSSLRGIIEDDAYMYKVIGYEVIKKRFRY